MTDERRAQLRQAGAELAAASRAAQGLPARIEDDSAIATWARLIHHHR